MERKVTQKAVSDLGIAAYLMMHGYKVTGRKSRVIYFEVDDKDLEEFDSLSFDYLTSVFHTFDSCLMSLKKIGERDPAERQPR